MAGANVAAITKILKTVYEPAVTEQLNNEILLPNRLQKDTRSFSGNKIVAALHKTRSAGVGAADDDAALPSPGSQGFETVQYDVKQLYGVIRVTGPAIERAADDRGAFVRILEAEMSGMKNDLLRDFARQSYGDGTGAIAAVSSVLGAVVTLASNEYVVKGDLSVGMLVDIGTNAAPTGGCAAATIVDVDETNGKITLDADHSGTITNAMFVGRANARSASGSREVTGLQAIVSDSASTLGGLDPTAAGNSYWDNQRLASGGTVTKDTLNQARAQVRVKGGNTSLAVSSFGVQRQFFNLLQGQVRYADSQRISGGFQALDWAGLPLYADRDAPFGKLYLLDEQFIRYYEMKGWAWDNSDGSVLKWDQGYDAYKAFMKCYCNFGASRRNVHLVVTGITDTGF